MSNKIYKRLIRRYGFINPEKDTWDGFMDRFPILFKQKDCSMQKTCMCWGIECPIGWKYFLNKLCVKLEYLNIDIGAKYKFEIQAAQVKEKYGTLRFYYDIVDMLDANTHLNFCTDAERDIIREYLDDVVADAIDECEEITYNICADCGTILDEHNRVETNGWITYICKYCDSNRHKKCQNTASDDAPSIENEKTNAKDA